MESAIVDATPGRLIFNERIPQDLGFVDRSDPSKKFDLEIMFTCGKKELGKIEGTDIEMLLTEYHII